MVIVLQFLNGSMKLYYFKILELCVYVDTYIDNLHRECRKTLELCIITEQIHRCKPCLPAFCLGTSAIKWWLVYQSDKTGLFWKFSKDFVIFSLQFMPYLLRIVLLIFRQIKNIFFKDFVTFVFGLWSIEFFNRYQWLPIQQKQRPENQNNDAKTMEFTELETRFSDTPTHHYLHHHHHYTTSSLNFYTVINVGDKNTKKK